MLKKIAAALLPLCRALSRWFKGSFLITMFNRYRPERHYMRGSGPKSRAAHSGPGPDSKSA
jgi:hypothetical protein